MKVNAASVLSRKGTKYGAKLQVEIFNNRSNEFQHIELMTADYSAKKMYV